MNRDRHGEVWGDKPITTPTLKAGVAVLRPYTYGDAALVRSAALDPAIPHVTTDNASHAMQYISEHLSRPVRKQGWSFVIADAKSLEPVGHIGAWLGNLLYGRVTLGYWVLERYRRRGYSSAALETITPWIANMDGVHRLELHIEPSNIASCRTAERALYVREATLKRYQIVDGTPRDMHVYSYFND